MKRKMRIAVVAAGASFFVWMACAAGWAQQGRSTTGSVASGWSSARDSAALDQGRTNLFSVLQLDHKGIILDPRFISYQISPRYSSGLEDFYTGQREGSGIGFESRFLPNAPWPFWFSYNKFRNLFPTISGNADDGTSNSSNLALGGALAVSGLPSFSIQYDRYTGSTDIGDAELLLYENDGDNFSVSSNYKIKGWALNGRVAANNDLYKMLGETDVSQPNRDKKGKLSDFSIQRDLGPDAMFLFSGQRNRYENSSDIVDVAIESQQLRSFFRYHKNKIHASVQYNSTQFNDRQELHFADTSPEETTQAFSGQGSNQNLSSSLTYIIRPFMEASGSLAYATAEESDGLDFSRKSSSFQGSSGINFIKSVELWGVHAGYNLHFAPQSLGHSANAGFVFGNQSFVRVAANYNWSRTRNEQGLYYGRKQQVRGGTFSVSKRTLGFMQLQVRGEFQTRTLDTLRQVMESAMRGFRVSVQVPKIQFSYSRRITSTNNWLYSWISPLGTELTLLTGGDTSMLLKQADDNLQLAYSDTPLRAHGQNIEFPTFQPAVDSPSPYRDISITETVPELISRLNSGRRSTTTLTASLAITRRMRLYGSWQDVSREEGLQIPELNDSYASDQKKVAFEWRIGQTRFEVSYYRYRFDGVGTQSFRKEALVKVTRHFRLF